MVITLPYLICIQSVSVIVMKKGNTELRYDRYVRELEELEKKRARKVKQILEIKKRLNI